MNTLKLPWLLSESINEQASAILDSNIQYISWSTEVGRWRHVKKQGWVYAMSTVVLQCENSGKEGNFGQTTSV